MSTIAKDEYRKLALDSSNDMMEHDADRTLGRYAEAAWHILQAGHGRVRMGELALADGNFTRAAADWLSAAACFDLATDPKRMRDALDRAKGLDREGKIPPERRDIHAALKEREQQFNELVRRLTQFRQEYARIEGTLAQSALDWLTARVREFPGYAYLHLQICSRARMIGRRDVAIESLRWARRFDSESAHLATLQVQQLFDYGEPAEAIRLAQELLDVHPELGMVRFLCAQALAFRTGPSPADWHPVDWQAALEILQPLVALGSPDTLEKLMAFGLMTFVFYGIGDEDAYLGAIDAFDKLASVLSGPLAKEFAERTRRAMPRVFPRPGSVRSFLPAEADYTAAREVFAQHVPLATV